MRHGHVVGARELDLVELSIVTTTVKQLLVASSLDDTTVIQHQDLIRVSNCRETVGDDEHGSSMHLSIECSLNQHLGLGIHA